MYSLSDERVMYVPPAVREVRAAELEGQVAGGTLRAGKAMTRTMGDPEKMPPEASKSEFFDREEQRGCEIEKLGLPNHKKAR